MEKMDHEAIEAEEATKNEESKPAAGAPDPSEQG